MMWEHALCIAYKLMKWLRAAEPVCPSGTMIAIVLIRFLICGHYEHVQPPGY